MIGRRPARAASHVRRGEIRWSELSAVGPLSGRFTGNPEDLRVQGDKGVLSSTGVASMLSAPRASRRPRGCEAITAPELGQVVAAPAHEWHSHAMARTRVSTTVDEGLLTEAREVAGAPSDAALLDWALGALLAQHRNAEIDRAYAAYDEQPLNQPDEWGDLASFREAAGAS